MTFQESPLSWLGVYTDLTDMELMLSTRCAPLDQACPIRHNNLWNSAASQGPTFGLIKAPRTGTSYPELLSFGLCPSPTNRFLWKWNWPLGVGGGALFVQLYLKGYDITLWECVSWGKKGHEQDLAHFKSTLWHGGVNQLPTPDRTFSHDEQYAAYPHLCVWCYMGHILD